MPREQVENARPIHRVPERRVLSADRRETWRGSRRDVDWFKHFQDETAARRERLFKVRQAPLVTL